jgi:hypothetical protein
MILGRGSRTCAEPNLYHTLEFSLCLCYFMTRGLLVEKSRMLIILLIPSHLRETPLLRTHGINIVYLVQSVLTSKRMYIHMCCTYVLYICTMPHSVHKQYR